VRPKVQWNSLEITITNLLSLIVFDDLILLFSEADQLCVLVTSCVITLPVVFTSNFEPSLQKILVDELKFVEFPIIGCLFHKGTSFLELAGIMLHVETVSHLKYSLTVCAR
jgi:hypothetical protein